MGGALPGIEVVGLDQWETRIGFLGIGDHEGREGRPLALLQL